MGAGHATRGWIALGLAAALFVTHPATAQESPRRFTVAAAGDVLIHERLADLAARNSEQPGEWDFRPMLEPIAPWVQSADLALCHLESVLSPTNTGLKYWPRFVVPNQIADALVEAGWDGCSVASNHALDGGFSGVVDTLDELDERGLGHAGTARTPAERLPTLYDAAGVTVAHLSFSQHFNGLEPPTDRQWAANRIDIEQVLADARWAREQGAEFVIASFHWGVEYRVDPIGYQRSVAEAILADPAVDLILGHHPHVVEPIGQVGDKYVAYSMGNHVSNQHSDWGPDYFATNEGQLLLFDVVERPDGTFAVERIRLVPTWVRRRDLHVFAAYDAMRLDIEPEAVLTTAIDRTVQRTMLLGVRGVELVEQPLPWPHLGPPLLPAGRRFG